jgi:hypothetical protein
MDDRERWEQVEEPYFILHEWMRKHMWSNMPAVVTENSDGHTLKCQPSIKFQQTNPDETTEFQDHPILQDVPVTHIGGGGVVLTFPIAKGDEVLLNFASRAIDTWHQSGGSQQPIDTRDHSISDAIAVPGLWSTPRKIQNASTSTVQLRTTGTTTTRDAKTGETRTTPTAFMELTPGGVLNFKGTNWTTDVPTHAYKGHLTVTGEITLNGIDLSTHKHNNVAPGGALTGPPVSSLELMQRWGIMATPVAVTLLAIDIVLRLIHAIP